MGEKAIKGKAITKVLSCFVVFAILLSVVPCAVVAAVADVDSNITGETADICPACSERAMPAGGEITKATIEASLAPGYCPSSGGSHEYEYILNVAYTMNPGGTMAITVDIYIANPTGCTYGEPCPEYDSSPEYINVWIDWNGDKDFYDPGEKVMDVALTGYLGINYRGTMTTSNIVTIPSDAVSSTWMRVNLGWGHDQNDPCEGSWTWGNVVDNEVQVQVVEPPKIEKIIITPKNPMTRHDVTFEAKITDAPGFEVWGVDWIVADVKSGKIDFFDIGNKNPYTHKPAAGTHGKKKVICTIFYKNKATGATGLDQESKEFKLFFEKTGHEDGDSKPPNWFKYWSKVVTPSLLGTPKPKMVYSGSSYFVLGTKEIHLSDGDAGSYRAPFGLHNPLEGIDNFVWSVVHESQHYAWAVDWWKNSDTTWQKAKGKTGPDDDKDKDGVPNKVEDINLNGKWDPPAEKYNWSKYLTPGAPAAIINDEEYKNCYDHRDVTGTAYHKKDWANPGKQSNHPPDSPSQSQTQKCKELIPVLLSTATFNDTYFDQGKDFDNDGLYDSLTIEIGVNVTVAGNYSIAGGLKDGSGNVLLADNHTYMDIGNQSVILNFDGLTIHQNRVNGPYNLINLILYDENCGMHNYISDAYNTTPYNYIEFERPSTEFTGVYSDYGTDTDGDGVYDYLTVEVETTATIAGDYTIDGYLYGDDGTAIVFASTSTYLGIGTQTIVLNFDGLSIAQSKQDGPYTLSYLTLYDENDTPVDFIYDAYNTSAYSYTDFQSPTASFRDTYSDYGLDTNSDGFHEYLTVDVELDITTAGNYSTHGCLYDIYGNETAEAYNLTYLNTGNQIITLNFGGNSIYKHGANGSFNLTHLLLYDENGTLVDNMYYAYTTSAYSYTDFQPLIRLTGSYLDYGTDTDGDGLFDNLTIDVEVILASEGHCVATARLIDSNGEEIIWASNTSWLEANKPQIIQLNFNGSAIYENGVNGPYYLKDVYIYHTGDPTQPDYVHDAYTTAVYNYTDFEGFAPPCKVQITSDLSLQDRPSIVYANGYYYVAYQSHEKGYGIFIKKFDSQWNFKKKVEVVSGSAYYDSPSLVFANNKLYVAYVSNAKGANVNDYDVIVKEYDPNSLACLSGEKYLTTLQSRQDLPALYYKDGYFYLAYRSWERGSSYNGDICIKKFDSHWNQLKKVQVTSKGSLQARPSLTYANGYLYVAYYSMETGDRDIFVKRLDSNLNLDGFKKQITSEASEQSFPSISFVNNQFTIVYGSTETGTLGIYMKKYDSNWNFIGKTKVVDDNSAHERRPSMTYAQNNYWIAYVHNLVGSDDWNIFAITPGCEDGSSPTPTPTLKLLWEITVDKAEYSPGDYVHLTQQFTNEGEETVLIANPITTTFIASDGSIVLEEDLSSSISVTLGAGGQWSFGTSYKLPGDAPEGYYDVRVSISGGNYVKTAEDLFRVNYPV